MILIVDDDADIRTALSMVLATRGYRSAEARNGKQALELLKGGLRPSVIVLDMMMPEMNGWDFLAAVRDDDDLSSMPVVAVTGYRSMMGEGPIDGTVGLLTKPLDVKQLLEILSAHR